MSPHPLGHVRQGLQVKILRKNRHCSISDIKVGQNTPTAQGLSLYLAQSQTHLSQDKNAGKHTHQEVKEAEARAQFSCSQGI